MRQEKINYLYEETDYVYNFISDSNKEKFSFLNNEDIPEYKAILYKLK